MNITERAAIVLQQIDAALATAETATPGPWYNAGGWTVLSELDSGTMICNMPNGMEKRIETVSFIAASRTLLPTSLRCLRTAINGLLKARDATVQLRAHADPLLTTLCDQWEAGQ